MNNNKSSLFLVLIPLLGGTALKAPFGCCDADPDMYPRYPTRVTPSSTAAQQEEKRKAEKAEQARREAAAKEAAEELEYDEAVIAWGECDLQLYERFGVLTAYCLCGNPGSCKLNTHRGKRLPVLAGASKGYWMISKKDKTIFQQIFNSDGSVKETSPLLRITTEEAADSELVARYNELTADYKGPGYDKRLDDLLFYMRTALEKKLQREMYKAHKVDLAKAQARMMARGLQVR